MKKRSRTDIYADILEVLKHRPEGALVTRISYGAGLPLDRIKPMLKTLADFGLLSICVAVFTGTAGCGAVGWVGFAAGGVTGAAGFGAGGAGGIYFRSRYS